MQGLDLLVKGHEYVVCTQFGEYPNLVFMGFFKENDDVTLACFDDVQQGWESFFDISVPDNIVKKV
jgi:hypothetical protein